MVKLLAALRRRTPLQAGSRWDLDRKQVETLNSVCQHEFGTDISDC
jgi:hypothetical protein